MDKYHIFNEIGAGRQSQVFKGRQKKTVNYVAIKRVEKSQMDKVVNEVQMMHALNHPHTLKFYDWYETRNNLWLILEYCSGGDLKSLLRVDRQLPIPAVKLLAGDLLAGLQYLHFSGVLYCDLKPSNVLIDEHGILKLAGFGLARRIPTLGNRSKAPKNRGTPYYMAPELFMKEGVHNFGSDLWSLGCVLYELASGRPPFASTSLNELMEQIIQGAPDLSPDVFRWRLEEHQQQQQDEQAPAPAPLAAAATAIRCWSDAQAACSTADFVEALRLLLRKDALARPTWTSMRSPESFWNDVLPPPPNKTLPAQPLFEATVASQRQSSEAPTPRRASSSAIEEDDDDDEQEDEAGAESAPRRRRRRRRRRGGGDAEAGVEEVLRLSRLYQEHVRSSELSKRNNTVAAAGERIDVEIVMNESEDPRGRRHTNKSTTDENRRAWWDGPTHFGAERAVEIYGVVFASSDDDVRPILGSSATELAMRATRVKPKNVGFERKSVAELNALPHALLEAHLMVVYEALVDSESPSGISEIVSYLLTVCEVAQVANVVVNSSFVSLILHVVKTRGGCGTLRHRILVLVGLLLRHATYVAPVDDGGDDDSNLVTTLKTLVTDGAVDIEARQLALAALGELLFYMTTTREDVDENDPIVVAAGDDDDETRLAGVEGADATAPEKELGSAQHHQRRLGPRVFSEVMEVIAAFLEEPGPLAHFAARTIGNVLSRVPTAHAEAIASIHLVATLARHAVPALTATSVETGAEMPRAALASLVHLFRSFFGLDDDDDRRLAVPGRLEAMIAAIEHLGGADTIADCVVTALTATDDARWQIVVLNLLNLCLVQRAVSWDAERRPELAQLATLPELEARLAAAREQLLSDHRVAAALVRAVGGGSCITSTVRAKAAVALLQLGVAYLPTLASVIVEIADDATAKERAGLLTALERLVARDVKELRTDSYFASCVFALLAFVVDATRLLTWVLARAFEDSDSPETIEHLAVDAFRAAFDFARPASDPVSALFDTFKTPAGLLDYLWAQLSLGDVAASFLLVASAVSSPLLRPHVLTSDLVVDLGRIVSALSTFTDHHNLEDLPTFYILYQTLPALLDALVSRDALVLVTHADVILTDDGLLPAACHLLASHDHDVRLTAAHLLRHTLPPFIQALVAQPDATASRTNAIARLFAVQLPDACARLLASCKDDSSLMETECMLRLLLESIPRWHAVPVALAASTRLLDALVRCVDVVDPNSTLASLARQVHRALQR
ncbi:hypothetical protein CTAYLR_007228 [Chrysophaeum taylorii]|uniref:Protein kinase domain-containing protein n=1 Tax=Chrysophaeum taylorii TaxID=2483200 RepID=A0AAD7XME1_9STRA|nr:hypothetical protein CTAYLR_007228 [Chrysophaeum taylorii]